MTSRLKFDYVYANYLKTAEYIAYVLKASLDESVPEKAEIWYDHPTTARWLWGSAQELSREFAVLSNRFIEETTGNPLSTFGLKRDIENKVSSMKDKLKNKYHQNPSYKKLMAVLA